MEFLGPFLAITIVSFVVIIGGSMFWNYYKLRSTKKRFGLVVGQTYRLTQTNQRVFEQLTFVKAYYSSGSVINFEFSQPNINNGKKNKKKVLIKESSVSKIINTSSSNKKNTSPNKK